MNNIDCALVLDMHQSSLSMLAGPFSQAGIHVGRDTLSANGKRHEVRVPPNFFVSKTVLLHNQ